MRILKWLIAIFIVSFANAQKIEFSGEITATAIFSNEDSIPFWLMTNTSASIGAETNFSGIGDAQARYNFLDSEVEVGVALFYRDGVNVDEFQRRDLYARYKSNWLKVTAGSKKYDVKLNSLSATNMNFLLSTNPRPLPGLIIEANNPINISKSLAIDWGIAHYSLNDDRHVDNALVHYKRLGLHWKINDRHVLKGTLQHFAQWGGTSPTEGKQDVSFESFLDVFVAKQTGNRVNAEGNHLGSYLLEYDLKTNFGQFAFYHEHPFEDGSGTRFANFPDGVWGVFFKPKSKEIITSVLYEYIDTTDQSFYVGGSGIDSYFNHRIYRSGWSYDGQTLGLPFITPPTNNSVRAHQFGLTSTIKKIDITLKTSIVESNGTLSVPFETQRNNIYALGKAVYSIEKYGQITLLFGYDYNKHTKDIVGVGLSYAYTFNKIASF